MFFHFRDLTAAFYIILASTHQSPPRSEINHRHSTSPRPQSIQKNNRSSSQGFSPDISINASQSVSLTRKLDDSPSGSSGGQGHSPVRTSGTPEGAHAVSLTSSGALKRSQEVSASDGPLPQNFQTQFFRNMIEDAMADFEERIHNQYLNLHLEMIRQFQIQQVRGHNQSYV